MPSRNLIIYEVNISIDKTLRSQYAEFLGGHIDRMLEIDGFKKADWWERSPSDEGSPVGKALWTVHYYVESREKLERYFTTEAKEMRAEGVKIFGDKAEFSRRILVPVVRG